MRCSSGFKFRSLLFLTDINNRPNCLLTSTSVSMFADNTNISIRGVNANEFNERLNEHLYRGYIIATASTYHKLRLNNEKTEYMII